MDRPGRRLPGAESGAAGAPSVQDRPEAAGRQPPADQAHHARAPRRRRAAEPRLGRLPHAGGMDSRGGPLRQRGRPSSQGNPTAGGVSPPAGDGGGRGAAASGDGHSCRRDSGRRDRPGELRVQRPRGGRGSARAAWSVPGTTARPPSSSGRRGGPQPWSSG